MRTLIVVVNYNGLELSRDCLRTLGPELAEIPDAHVGLCDNGSQPGEADRLEAAVNELGLNDRVTLTRLSLNRGFTGGNNAVIARALEQHSDLEYVYLLNNDTLVKPGAVAALVRFLDERPQVGIVGGRQEHPDGRIQSVVRRFLNPINEFESRACVGPISWLLSRWRVAPPQTDSVQPCDWVPGASMMIRRAVLERVGLLDEDLFTYFDDVDICLRAKRAGWPTWYCPQSRIVHLIGRTTGITGVKAGLKRRPAYWFLARRLYYLKNYGALTAGLADVAAVAGLCLWKLRSLIQPSRRGMIPPKVLWDHLRHSVFIRGLKRTPVPNPALQAEPNHDYKQPQAT